MKSLSLAKTVLSLPWVKKGAKGHALSTPTLLLHEKRDVDTGNPRFHIAL